jgi:hypothetical protein
MKRVHTWQGGNEIAGYDIIVPEHLTREQMEHVLACITVRVEVDKKALLDVMSAREAKAVKVFLEGDGEEQLEELEYESLTDKWGLR